MVSAQTAIPLSTENASATACHQCMKAQQLAGTADGAEFSDSFETHKCACISADGVQCSMERMAGKEWCYNCSAGYCDCSCIQCVKGADQEESGGTHGEGDSGNEVEAMENEPAESTAAKPLTPLKIRAAGLREATAATRRSSTRTQQYGQDCPPHSSRRSWVSHSGRRRHRSPTCLAKQP